MLSLSHDQKLCLDHILEWWKKDSTSMQYVTLGGYAGTGKTTLIAQLRRHLHSTNKKLRIGFASYTGKAARVLADKLSAARAVGEKDSVGTIHSLIYTPMTNDREEIIGWKPKDAIDCDLVIIDEASMVDRQIWDHLLSYKKPIIVVGDHGQLPPIEGSFSLMARPDITLSEIHRQESENPIIALSIQARTKGSIDPGRYAPGVIKFSRDDQDMAEIMQDLLNNITADTMILCGYNATRKRLNAAIRANLGFESPEPSSGDRVICLRNNHRARIVNGQLGTVRRIFPVNEQWYEAVIDMDGAEKPYSGIISKPQFAEDRALNFTDRRRETVKCDLFDFGYALTVHKAQGSQARRVILFEERFSKMDDEAWRRWLYTAVTRAEEELFIFPSR